MGGERETKGKAAVSTKPGAEFTSGDVRVHESGGEVHFHVSGEKLKVAVPVRMWYVAMEKLVSSPGEVFEFIDPDSETQ